MRGLGTIGQERDMGPLRTVGGGVAARPTGVRTRLNDLENEIAALEGDVLGLGDLLGPILADPAPPVAKGPQGELVPCDRVIQRVERAIDQIRWVRGLLQDLGGRVDL